MSTRKQIQWPTLVREGGWRQRKGIGYWPSFVRMRKGKVQQISWMSDFQDMGSMWILEHGSLIFSGTLDGVLLKAETL